MQDQSKVMFVHVPRTAGSAITYCLQNKSRSQDGQTYFGQDVTRSPIYRSHDPLYILEEMNHGKDLYKFSVVRNPYTRTFSNYKAFSAICQMNGVTRFSKEMSFNDFLNYVRSYGSQIYSAITINATPFCIFDQTFYIHDKNGNMSLDKLYKFEDLKSLENDFEVRLPHLTYTRKTSHEEYLNEYTKENINLVKHIFFRDFSVLNYSTHFDDSYCQI